MRGTAQGGVVLVGRRVLSQTRVDELAWDFLQGGLGPDACEWCADAVVDAPAETVLLVVPAVGNEAVGVGEAEGSRLPEAGSRTTEAALGW